MVLQALRAEARGQPGRLSASVFGYDDVLARAHPFLRSWRASLTAAAASGGGSGAAGAGGVLTPYVISSDVRRAFDSVDIDKLLGIVEPVFQQPDYLVRARRCDG